MRPLEEYEEEVPGRPGWIQINKKKCYWHNERRKNRGWQESLCTQCKCRLSDFDIEEISPLDWHTLCWRCKTKWYQPLYLWFVDKDMKFYLWRWRMLRRILRFFNKDAKIPPLHLP